MMRISQQGLDLIKQHESFSPTVYICPAGRPTIGYGHCVLPHEKFIVITEQEGDDLLRKDVAFAEECINKAVKVPITQNQFDALVSLVFNIGSGAFLKSSLLRQLNETTIA
jgi:lysozyme